MGRVEAETLRVVEIGIFLVDQGLFSAKVLPKLRGLLHALGTAPAKAVSALEQRITELAEQRGTRTGGAAQ